MYNIFDIMYIVFIFVSIIFDMMYNITDKRRQLWNREKNRYW